MASQTTAEKTASLYTVICQTDFYHSGVPEEIPHSKVWFQTYEGRRFFGCTGKMDTRWETASKISVGGGHEMVKKVLLVDDDPFIRRIASISLASVGKFEVIVASSGPEGLQMAIEHRPDVILLDVMMPGEDGPTAIKKLQAAAATASIPVIFMTAKVQAEEVQQYLNLGAVGVITKPFDPISLPSEIRSLVSTHPLPQEQRAGAVA